ncbi:TPA: J domain-containing protein [Salmonella enterica subsp. enterica serovar Java]
MNIQQALNIFGLSGELTAQDVKKAYKQAALKFHPDRNPVGAEMMKAVNAAFDFLMENIDRLNTAQSANESACYNFGEELENVLNALQGMTGVIFEVAGNWIWISGDTKTHKDAIKALGCKWASKKQMWFYRPEEYKASRNRKERSIDEIRAMYGTTGQRNATGFKQVETRA